MLARAACRPEQGGAWLYRLAVRQVLIYRRKHGRRRKLVDRFASQTQPTEVDRRTMDPLQWLLADERGKLVRLAWPDYRGAMPRSCCSSIPRIGVTETSRPIERVFKLPELDEKRYDSAYLVLKSRKTEP